MESRLYFFYGDNDYVELPKLLPKLPDPYWVITDSDELHEILKELDIETEILGQLVPEHGPQAKEIFGISKKIYEKYLNLFSEIKIKDISIIFGFDHVFLRKIYLLIKIREILNKKKNVIFIFEGRFTSVYFSILKLSHNLGYSTNLEVGFIKNNKITYISNRKGNSKNVSTKLKVSRLSNFIKNSYSKSSSFFIYREILKSLLKISVMYSKIIIHKFLNLIGIDSSKIVLNKINRKMKKSKAKYSSKYIFFITASRLDLYFRPFENVIKKLGEEHLSFHIISSDLSTDVMLNKNSVQHLDFFEEMKLLIELIKNSNDGQLIRGKTKIILHENNLLSGIEELYEEILENFYRSASFIIICEFILKHMNLKSIIVAPSGEMFENIAIEVARKHRIPSYSFLPGVINPEPILSDWLHSDMIFVSGEAGVESLTSLGYDKSKLILTGDPKYDFFKMLDSSSKLEFSKEYGIDSTKKLIVVAMSRWHEKDELWMSRLIKFVNQNDFEIVIKIHPFYITKLHQESEKKIRTIQQSCKNLRYTITYHMEVYKLLHMAELVITDYSNAGIEAVFLEKPIIALNFIKENSDRYPQRLDKYGAAIYVDEYSDLEVIILEILNKKMYLEELKNGRKKAINRFNFKNDGLASQRIVEILTKGH